MKTEIPEYWKKHIDLKLEKINAIREMAEGKIAEFIFSTDTHVEVGENRTPELCRYIIEKTGIDKVVFGGDFMDGRKDKNEALKNLKRWRDLWCDLPVYGVRGNHDTNTAGDFTEENRMTDEDYREQIYKYFKNENNGKGFYSYVDDEKNKIRYFLLDTGAKYSQFFGEGHEKDFILYGAPIPAYKEQLDFVWEKSKELGRNWHVVAIQHIIIGGQNCKNPRPVYLMPQGKDLLVTLDKIQEDPDMPRVLVAMCGHNHIDREMLGMGGYPVLSTTCDSGTLAAKHSQENPLREVGTTDEQAFDVVQLDLTNYRFYSTRIGYGKDRTYKMFLSVTQ